MPDIIEIEILEDGSIKMLTGRISSANHLSAESFVRAVATEAAGQTTRKRREGAHTHTHTHDGHTHSH